MGQLKNRDGTVLREVGIILKSAEPNHTEGKFFFETSQHERKFNLRFFWDDARENSVGANGRILGASGMRGEANAWLGSRMYFLMFSECGGLFSSNDQVRVHPKLRYDEWNIGQCVV